jgi:Cu+-exporting ATPase
MERDVVCNMEIDRESAAGQSEYNGRTYYSCSSACKEQFDQNPEQYAEREVA